MPPMAASHGMIRKSSFNLYFLNVLTVVRGGAWIRENTGMNME